jgi:hypothetical protein
VALEVSYCVINVTSEREELHDGWLVKLDDGFIVRDKSEAVFIFER